MRPGGRQSGFTLLEMLVATAMTAMLAGSLYASLYIAFRARHTAVATTDTIRFGTQAMAIIESDLKSAPNPNGILVGTFIGQSGQQLGTSAGDELTFYTALAVSGDPPIGSGEIKKIDYALVKAADSDEMALVRNVTDNLLAQVEAEPRQEIICRGVHSLTMQYYDGTTWQTGWDSTQQLDSLGQPNNLPIAVQISIELDGPDKTVSSRLTRTVLLPCCRLTPTTEGLQ